MTRFNSGDRVVLCGEVIEDDGNSDIYVEVYGIVDSYRQVYIRRDSVYQYAIGQVCESPYSGNGNSVVFVGAGC